MRGPTSKGKGEGRGREGRGGRGGKGRERRERGGGKGEGRGGKGEKGEGIRPPKPTVWIRPCVTSERFFHYCKLIGGATHRTKHSIKF